MALTKIQRELTFPLPNRVWKKTGNISEEGIELWSSRPWREGEKAAAEKLHKKFVNPASLVAYKKPKPVFIPESKEETLNTWSNADATEGIGVGAEES